MTGRNTVRIAVAPSGGNSTQQPAIAGAAERWFLVFTKAAGEETAKVNLERQGYGVYYPRLLRPTLRQGRWADRIVALFPRYLFVQLDILRQALSPVRSTLGVTSIVRFGDESKVVPDTIIEGLIRRADPQTGLHRLSSCPTLQPGCKVHVVAGVFGGLDGIFEREAADERVVVLLKLLGRDTPVRVPARFVQPAPAA